MKFDIEEKTKAYLATVDRGLYETGRKSPLPSGYKFLKAFSEYHKIMPHVDPIAIYATHKDLIIETLHLDNGSDLCFDGCELRVTSEA